MSPVSGPTSASPSKPSASTPESTHGAKAADAGSFADTLKASAPPTPPSGAPPDPSAPLAPPVPPLEEAPKEANAPDATSESPPLVEQAAAEAPAETPTALRGRAPGEAFEPRRARPDPLDPAARHAAQMAPLFTPAEAAPGASLTPAAPPAETQAHASLELMLPELVRNIAWAGDGKRGSMRLELGAGSLSGGVLVVHADEGRVRVELNAPAGTDVAAWKTRLHERLAQRGVDVDEVVVE